MISDFVKGGGTLMLSVGWEEKEASLPLMAAFGFSVDHLPLAQFISIIPAAGQRVRFFEAWPVLSREEGGEVIAAYKNYPVIMKKPYGKGTVVMIGDSSFFWNANLEMEESHTVENVEFLKWLLEGLKEERLARLKERPSGPLGADLEQTKSLRSGPLGLEERTCVLEGKDNQS